MTRVRLQSQGQPIGTVQGDLLDRRYPDLGSVRMVRGEIDDCYRAIQAQTYPAELMEVLAAWSARLSELRTRIVRIEDQARQWKPVRTQEIDPTLKELQTQFQIASRLISAKEFDWRMETGQR